MHISEYLQFNHMLTINLNTYHFGVTQKYLVNYAVWGPLQQRVCHHRQLSMVEELKRASMLNGRLSVSHRFINKHCSMVSLS